MIGNGDCELAFTAAAAAGFAGDGECSTLAAVLTAPGEAASLDFVGVALNGLAPVPAPGEAGVFLGLAPTFSGLTG